MCQFCVEHGEGKRWYLQAQNYAYDLDSDLKRREYILGFIRDFDAMRSTAITAGEVLGKLPAPLGRFGKHAISSSMQKHHFGQPIPIEDCEQVLEMATSITVIPCVCRMHERNRSAEEVCILVTSKPIIPLLAEGFADYDGGPELEDFHTMSAHSALALLRSCEERGLMHSIWTFQTPFTAAICNCNKSSGCMAMKLTAGYGIKIMWRGESIAVLDYDRCTRCGACKRVCPFEAVTAGNGRVTLHAEKCWGCGICRSACQSDAITLVERTSVPAVATLW